ncbi:MAG: DUF975 family protein [Lachnospiraceae bacterium]|nr:DUF975 family protein [Lachnospiraceae bacterium]
MWNRADLKAKGKEAFKRNYWLSVLVALILSVITGISSSSSSSGASNGASQATGNGNSLQAALEQMGGVEAFALVAVILGILATLALLFIVLDILVFNPLQVGCKNFFLKNSDANADLNTLGAGFKPRWGNVVVTTLLRDIFLALWFCLFIIPGIVKCYSYRLVPYILAENPDMKPTEVITLSRQMMNGQKMNAFILDLSFIGWVLLECITCGIAGVFYVRPYINATDAELYKAIKAGYAQQGNTVA